MDDFFSGLDSRLRMSVKVADSIMMGLVNAAMEDAYKKSLWKDGDLERLFQKLRFGELAIMQLEWCLRFVRGEMEAEGTDDGHEQLLDDLLETRDRIQARLNEAELAVADKDRDYMRRKHEELSSSRRETAATERAGSDGMHRRDWEGCVFGELRGSVDRQMSRMRGRLEDARSTLAALMQKVSGEASPMARLQEAGHEGDGVKGLSGFYSMAQLLMEFQDMVLDAGAVSESVASSFDVMERSISSLRATMDEQRWLSNAEKEIHGAVVEGFLRNVNVESPVLRESSSPVAVELEWSGSFRRMEWSGLMDDMKILQDELEILVSRVGMPQNLDDSNGLGANYRYICREISEEMSKFAVNTSQEANTLLKNTEDMSDGQPVSDLITDHETNLPQNSQENDSSKMAPCGENLSPCICKTSSFNGIKESASHVIARLNAIRSRNAKLTANSTGSQPLALSNVSDGTENSSVELEYLKDATRQLHSANRIPETSDSGQCYHSVEPGVCHEEVERLIGEKTDSEIKCELQGVLYTAMFRDMVRKLAVRKEAQKLTEEKDELDIRSKLQCEIYTTIFKDLVRKLAVESVEHLIKAFIKDEVQAILVAKTLNEWKSKTEMVHNERLIREEIDCIVFGGLTKDLTHDHNLSVLNSTDQIRPSTYLASFSIIDNIEQLQKMKMQINVTSEDNDVHSNQHQVPVKQEILSSSGNYDSHDSKESELQARRSTDKYGDSDSVNSDVEQALEQQDHKKLHAEDVTSSLSIPLEGTNLENGRVALILDEKHDARNSTASNATIGEQAQPEMQSPLIPFTNFQEIFMDFEAITFGKIGKAMLRLIDLDKELANLVEQVSSLKRSELIYRRAFTRRCYDLQTAETEVDLLGDEVELLLGLLIKTYKALDYYSPVLQHYIGIRDILNLLGKELAVRHEVQ